jgi:hypothetical protein
VEVQIPSQLQSLTKSFIDKTEAVEAGRMAAVDAEHHRLEARVIKKLHQEGALGALYWTYGVDAPHVARESHASEYQNQDVCSLLAQNPCSQNSHVHPIATVA